MPPVIDETRCLKCGLCAEICPLDVIRVKKEAEGKKIIVKYPYECWHCRACAKDCPAGAITLRYPLSHMMQYMDVPAEQKGREDHVN